MPGTTQRVSAKLETQKPHIMELIARSPWREAVTYRETWPHEYVVIQKDGQQELLAAFCRRIGRGEGVDGRFFHQQRKYLFLGEYKYWTMTECEDIDPETYDGALNRALLFKDRRDFISAAATPPNERSRQLPRPATGTNIHRASREYNSLQKIPHALCGEIKLLYNAATKADPL